MLDTGPLLAFIARGVEHHEWVCEQWKRLHPPLLTCEPVLTEATFLLKRQGYDADSLFELLVRGIVSIGFQTDPQLSDLRALMKRHRDRPMSLADACLVRMAEIFPGSKVLTFDRDFLIYRKQGNRVIPVLMPAD